MLVCKRRVQVIKVIKKKYDLKIVLIIFMLFFVNGCLGDPSEEDIRKWVKETVSKCDGTVNDLRLIREELLSNKFVGYAEVSINGKKYYPDVVAYADYKGQGFYQMQRNPCDFSGIKDSINSLRNLFE